MPKRKTPAQKLEALHDALLETIRKNDGQKIKKILVNEQMVDQLSRGRLAIVALGDNYEIVPDRVARKIMERDESAI